MTHLGDVLAAGRNYAQAETAFRRALAIREPLDGGEDAAAIPLLRKLVATLEGSGSAHGAEAIYRRLLALQEETAGADLVGLAATVNNFGLLKETGGDLDEAERLYKRALAIHEKNRTDKDPEAAATLPESRRNAAPERRVGRSRSEHP